MLLAPSLQMTCVRPDFPVDRPSALGFDELQAAATPGRRHRGVAVPGLGPPDRGHRPTVGPSPIDLVMLAGAPIPPDLVAGVRAVTGGDVRTPYGMTECLPVTDGTDPEAVGPLGGNSTGRPVPGCSVVVDAARRSGHPPARRRVGRAARPRPLDVRRLRRRLVGRRRHLGRARRRCASTARATSATSTTDSSSTWVAGATSSTPRTDRWPAWPSRSRSGPPSAARWPPSGSGRPAARSCASWSTAPVAWPWPTASCGTPSGRPRPIGSPRCWWARSRSIAATSPRWTASVLGAEAGALPRRPMRVLVTGGSSLLGRSVADRLVARGDAVTCFQRSPSGSTATDVLGDIRDRDAVLAGGRRATTPSCTWPRWSPPGPRGPTPTPSTSPAPEHVLDAAGTVRSAAPRLVPVGGVRRRAGRRRRGGARPLLGRRRLHPLQGHRRAAGPRPDGRPDGRASAPTWSGDPATPS